MRHFHGFRPWTIILYALALSLVFAIACGETAPAAQPPEAPPPAASAPAAPAPADAPQPPAAPVAEAAPTPAPPPPAAAPSSAPTGTLNAGLPDMGRFTGHPAEAILPSLPLMNASGMAEGLMLLDINRQIQGHLLESWSISDDFTTWTMKFPRGIQCHKGYGEMTSEDVRWSYQEGWALSQTHSRASEFNEFWLNPNGSMDTSDPYTLVVNAGFPHSAANTIQQWMVPGGAGNWVSCKRQFDEMGFEEADQNTAFTGSWEILEHRVGQWRMGAVENHWRQTPHFAELVFWEIPEESSRLAGFQTGQLDTFTMAIESIPVVQSVPGAKLMVLDGGTDYSLQIYGMYHVEALAGEPRASWDPDLPWISANHDVNSVEWQSAAKVRRALSIAIDRELIIETILGGYARPSIMGRWSYNEDRLEGRRWEHDPEQGRQLLAEAGYPNGFRITLTPQIQGAPGIVEACEAIATMWNNDLGIDVNFQRLPYSTVNPQRVARTYQGVICATGTQRVLPGTQVDVTVGGGTSIGGTHPFLEEIMPRIATAVDDRERERLEAEVGFFMFDHAFTQLGLFVGQTVTPVGPRIEEWTEHVNIRDLRFMNGYEYIQAR